MANDTLRLLLIDAHPRRIADPQDDFIFHPRTWQRAARLGQSDQSTWDARLFGEKPRTIQRWVAGHSRIPSTAVILIRALSLGDQRAGRAATRLTPRRACRDQVHVTGVSAGILGPGNAFLD